MHILDIMDGAWSAASKVCLTSHRLQTAAGGELMVLICPLGENVRLGDLWEGVGNIICRSKFLLCAWECQKLQCPVCADCCGQWD